MMLDDLILHPHTRKQVTQLAAQPSQAVLLVGADGIGKATLARALVVQTLGLPTWPEQHAYIRSLAPEKNAIPIDSIRELQHFLQLKTIGQGRYRRAVIVEHSNTLTTEAQNAFLKLLEEPPTDTLLLLTADTPRTLLPTIRSRLQLITVHPPEATALTTYFQEQGKQPAAIQRAYFLGGGLPGLMTALLQDDENHPLFSGVTLAKSLLQQNTFERLTLVERLSKQKDETLNLLEALQRIAQTGLAQAAQKQDTARLKQWHRIIKEVYATNQAMQYNANPKLALTNLMLHI